MFLQPIREISMREAQVAHGIARGLKYDEIAKDLKLSPSTVRHHAEALADRLDGELTDAERKKGPRYLILKWVTRLEGELRAVQTIDELIAESVKAHVRLTVALDIAAGRSRPSEKRREA